jgi:ABC-type dipeptide/oligopeptide/nickel transport system ATPase component
MGSNLLEVRNLNISLHYEKVPIVKNVSFDVHRERVLGIIGESGSGKTMICKSLMRLLNTKKFNISGNAFLNGKDIFKMDENTVEKIRGRKVSLIMQNPMTAFDPMSKIGSQIIDTLRVHFSISKAEAYERGVRALKKMNLGREEKIMESYPHTLSGGMLQRIMIALAIIVESSLLIADEVTTALDPRNQSMIINEFQKLRKSGIAMIVITHDFKVLYSLADDIIVLKNGEIIESGTVYSIFNQPKNKYTQELLEASNLIGELK